MKISNIAALFLFFVVCCGLPSMASMALDKIAFDNCIVTGYDKISNVLSVKVDPKIDTGTDIGCVETSKVIANVCRQGYKVKYFDRIIDLQEAERLVAYGGGY